MALYLDTKDKVKVNGEDGEELYCPPHHVPHKLPFTKPITDESCHYHEKNGGCFIMFHFVTYFVQTTKE